MLPVKSIAFQCGFHTTYTLSDVQFWGRLEQPYVEFEGKSEFFAPFFEIVPDFYS